MFTEARSRSTEKRFFGVYEAIVTDVNDPGQEGRVKVRFPWFDQDMETLWCRVRQFYAGNGYGAFFVPEVNDEVLVAFIQGDMRLPIILGGLYNGQDRPPTHRADDRDEKMIRTRGGHRITLDDTSGSEKITIIDARENNRIEIDTANNSITIKSTNGKLILQASEIEVSADSTIKIEAGGQMDLKGSTINLN
ncbi:MAG TPA: phage baseplate assembly protein V [Blastocatellia bacterium]|nr:phage baseplate assembly protein V [Blastocatellia bacterium]